MSNNKLKKAGTMVVAAAEGEDFLKRTWGEDKFQAIKNITQLLDSTEPAEPAKPEEVEEEEKPVQVKEKPKLSKNSTMIATIKDSEHILKDSDIATDAKTRRQSERISKLMKEKPKLAKHSTMLTTAQESKLILKGVSIDVDARTRKQASTIKRLTTAPKKKTLKKKGTMEATRQDAVSFIKRNPLKNQNAAKMYSPFI